MEPKPLSDMTPDERAEAEAMLAKREAERPDAGEPYAPAMFTPGVIFFQDGQYRAVSPDVATVWPWMDYILAALLRMLPRKHSLEYWRERIERGATMALAFVDSGDMLVRDAGMLNCDMSDDGKRTISVFVCTFDQLNLEHAARLAEISALAMGTEQVHLWTPVAVPIVPGYRVENCWFGQLQVTDIEPIQ
jgi:hypothetical protein